MSKQGILLIGCGKQAPKHISGLRRVGLDTIFLHDNNSAAAEALAEKEGLTWVDDLDTALGDRQIVAVDICTPTPTHAPLLTRAFRAGKHAFCEKPLASSAAEARELESVAREQECRCAVGYVYRFAPVFESLKEMLDAEANGSGGALGRTVCANIRIGGRGSHAVWKHRVETGGGAVNEMLVHMLDLAIWLFGRDAAVEPLVSNLLRPVREIRGVSEPVDADDYAVARMHYRTPEGEIEVLIQADLLTPEFSQLVTVQGENGSFLGSIQSDIPSHVFLIAERGGYQSGTTSLSFPPANLFEKQMADFAAMLSDPQHKPRCPIDESVEVMELIEKLRAA